MGRVKLILILNAFFFSSLYINVNAQEKELLMKLSNQSSILFNYSKTGRTNIINLNSISLPRIYLDKSLENNSGLDLEFIPKIDLDFSFPLNQGKNSSKIDFNFYRLWMRYYNNKLDVRLGMQKINFGSSHLFRPLMWFDQQSPFDPLQITEGVWAGLMKYYWGNYNIWGWIIYPRSNIKGWEFYPTHEKKWPEIGGRIQIPVKRGELGLAYNNRNILAPCLEYDYYLESSENKAGIDLRLDFTKFGIWAEGSATYLRNRKMDFSQQYMINAGVDCTLNIGNGLMMTFEHLYYNYDIKLDKKRYGINFSALEFSYLLTSFDNIQSIIYYDWKSCDIQCFVNWQKQFDKLAFYLVGIIGNIYSSLNFPSGQNGILGTGNSIQMVMVINF